MEPKTEADQAPALPPGREFDAMELEQVLVENYLLLSASLEQQNQGKFENMLQFLTKLHKNIQQLSAALESAPLLAVVPASPTSNPAPACAGNVGGAAACALAPRPGEAASSQPPPASSESEAVGIQQGADSATAHAPAKRVKQPGRRNAPKRAKWHPTNQPYSAAVAGGSGGPIDDAVGLQRPGGLPILMGSLPGLPVTSLPQPPMLVGLDAAGNALNAAAGTAQAVSFAGGAAPTMLAPCIMLASGHAVPLLAPAPGRPPGGALTPGTLAGVNEPVLDLLAQLGLSKFQGVLQEQEVDMAALKLMTEQQLRDLGLPLGAVVKIKAAFGNV